MAISIQDLERAFAPVIEVATGELEVEVGGTILVLRSLNPEEENAIQAELFASLNSDEEEETVGQGVKASALLDATRIWTLSRAVVQIGDLDLRKQPFVETGETLGTGVPIKKARHEVISDILSKWSQPILKRLFRKYLQLTEQVESRAEKELKYEPSDLDAEISRLETRLESLKGRKTEIEEGEKSAFEQQLGWVSEQDEAERVETAEDASDLRAGVRARQDGPLQEAAPQQQPAAQDELGPGQRDGYYQPPVTPAREEREAVSDSFVSAGDDDAMAEAIQAETLRQLERRKKAGAPIGVAPDTSGLAALHAGQQKSPEVAPQVPATQPAPREEVVLDTPEEKLDQNGLRIDSPQTGSRNPRFRGRRQ